MCEHEQAAVYLRLRKEYQTLANEKAALEIELRHFGNSLLANSQILNKTPSDWNVDAEALCSDARKAQEQVKRLQIILVEIADKKEDLGKFGELFPPLA